MRIGQSTIPRLRTPALLKGQCLLFDLAVLEGGWGIICDLPRIEFCEAITLNQYHRTFEQAGAKLVGLLPFIDPFVESHLPKIKILNIPLLADPLGRLHRVLGISRTSMSDKCQSFIYDPNGVVRYHLVHGLNWRGLSFLVEILKHCQDHNFQPERQEKVHPSPSIRFFRNGHPTPESLPENNPTSLLQYVGGMKYGVD